MLAKLDRKTKSKVLKIVTHVGALIPLAWLLWDWWFYLLGPNEIQAITIRTMVFRGDTYSFQAGAGVVADSIPQMEYREVLAKSEIVRRALAMPGNLDSAAAVHAADYLMESLPYVVGKRAQASVGSVVRLEVTGHAPRLPRF